LVVIGEPEVSIKERKSAKSDDMDVLAFRLEVSKGRKLLFELERSMNEWIESMILAENKNEREREREGQS
jgi:hypothetical protein